jgi:multiple sugar transport system substrate-binding protein
VAIPASGALSTMGFGLGDEIAKTRVDTFKHAYPDVQLTVTEGDFDEQQFLSAVASGSPPDLVYMTRDIIGTYAARGAIQPLTECVSKAGIDMSNFRDSAVQQVTLDGSVYAIPEFFDTRVLIVNNKAVAAAGLTPDQVSTADWDALADVNRKLTDASGGKLSRIGFDPKLPEFLPLWAKANGADLLSADGRTAQLDDPKVVEALTYALGLIKDEGGWPTMKAFRDTWDFFGAKNQFAQDQLGAFPIEEWYISTLASNSPDVDITVKPFQDRQGNPMTFSGGNAWAMPTGAKNPDAACAFMATMTATPTWIAAANARADARAAANKPFTGVFTANKAADEQIFSTIVKPTGTSAFDEGTKTVLDVQDKSFVIPTSRAGAEFQKAWMDAVNRALNGQQSPEDALKQAQQDAQSALDAAQ